MKRIVLHIGHDKTATCSIQDTFKKNGPVLETCGYYYPLPDGHTHHNKLFILLFKENLAQNKELLLTHEIDPLRIDTIRSHYRSWLIDKLLKTRAETVIFSGEYFPNFKASEIEAIKAFFNKIFDDPAFEIYGYTRDPVDYASSAYQQRARLFPSDTKILYFPYGNTISRYLEAFGQNNVHLFKFEDACSHIQGPVCFLMNKIGLKDENIAQMQIVYCNESMSDMGVDLLVYINREIPYTESNIKKGLRRRFDCKHLISLPGRKYQLQGRDAEVIVKRTQKDMVWLRDNFSISYSVSNHLSDNNGMEFDTRYIEKMITLLPKSNTIIRKLVYDYIKSRLSKVDYDSESQKNLQRLASHFKQKYYLTTTLSYTSLAYPQRITVFAYNLLKRSETLRRLKRRWIDKPLPIYQVE